MPVAKTLTKLMNVAVESQKWVFDIKSHWIKTNCGHQSATGTMSAGKLWLSTLLETSDSPTHQCTILAKKRYITLQCLLGTLYQIFIVKVVYFM